MESSLYQDLVPVGPVRIGLVGCYDGPVPTSGRRRNHIEPVCCAWLVRRGRVRLRWREGSLESGPGRWVLVPARWRRDQDFSADAALASLRLAVVRRDGAPVFAEAAPCLLDPLLAPGLEPAVARLATAPDQGLAAACRVQARLLDAAAAWWEAVIAAGWRPWSTADGDRRLAAALATLAAHDRIPPVPWPSLQAATGLSRRQLDRLFIDHLGTTPAGWLDARMRERAAALLADPVLAVKTVADRLGFRDASHFARWFRRGAGRSPRAARSSA